MGTYEKIRVNKMDMDKTEKNQEKFTCGEFEYQVIRSARKTMTLEVRRDGNVIVRAPLRIQESAILLRGALGRVSRLRKNHRTEVRGRQ